MLLESAPANRLTSRTIATRSMEVALGDGAGSVLPLRVIWALLLGIAIVTSPRPSTPQIFNAARDHKSPVALAAKAVSLHVAAMFPLDKKSVAMFLNTLCRNTRVWLGGSPTNVAFTSFKNIAAAASPSALIGTVSGCSRPDPNIDSSSARSACACSMVNASVSSSCTFEALSPARESLITSISSRIRSSNAPFHSCTVIGCVAGTVAASASNSREKSCTAVGFDSTIASYSCR